MSNKQKAIRRRKFRGALYAAHAAQALTIALAQLHQLLNTDNQTVAVMRLKELINLVQSRN